MHLTKLLGFRRAVEQLAMANSLPCYRYVLWAEDVHIFSMVLCLVVADQGFTGRFCGLGRCRWKSV